jgi:ABC-type multidrug transport system ATPase subunit
MDEAEYCDRISIMNEGKIVALDTPENLKKQYDAATVEEVFVKIARPHPPPDSYRDPFSRGEKGVKKS